VNESESKKLRVGDAVATDQLPPDEHHVGEVTETNWHAVKILWDDSQVGIVDHRDMEKIDRR